MSTTVVSAVIGLATSVITARFLGPEARGMLSAAILVGSLAAALSQFGQGPGLVYFLATKRPFNVRGFIARSVLVITAASVAIPLVLTRYLADGRLLPTLEAIIVFCVLSGLAQYMGQLTQVDRALKLFNAQRVMTTGGNLLLLLVCVAIFDRGSWLAVLYSQSLVLLLVALVSGGLVLRLLKPRETIEAPVVKYRQYARYAILSHGSVVLWLFQNNLDKFYLAAKADIADFGIYSVAYSVSRLLGSVQDAMSSALFSRFAGSGDSRMGGSIAKAFRLTFLPLLLVAGLIGAACPVLVLVAYGKDFRSMTPILIVLLFESVVAGSSRLLTQYFAASGRPGLAFARQIVAVTPLLAALPLVGSFERPALALAITMLIVATIGLVFTMVAIKFICREPWPRVLISKAEFLEVLRTLKIIRSR